MYSSGAEEFVSFLFILLLTVGPAVGFFFLGGAIGNSRGRKTAGRLLGLFLGPLGLIIAAVLPREGRRCPYCCEVVYPGATVCPHCRQSIASPKPAKRPRVATLPVTQTIIQCPHCGTRYRVAQARVGHAYHCRKCGMQFTPPAQ